MWIKALKRFNHHDPEDIFEVSDENGKVWIDEKLAEKAKKPEKEKAEPENRGAGEPEKKDLYGPEKDKAIKEPKKKK